MKNNRPKNFTPFIAAFLLYAAAIVLFDRISDTWQVSVAVVVPIVLVGQLIYIVCMPQKHVKSLSKLLFALSLLATPLLSFLYGIAYAMAGATITIGSRLIMMSVLFVPLVGLLQFLYFRNRHIAN